ncbi:hypothetical protein MTR67_031480 [Solanum verrucosum]|uniref:Tf2-1-like SH3-like domain-containing protein n=1 Tax=Solanum verrucosum TaxID=315347 RepID=A0AAF0U2I5_SOLVR|nr:hypothetical protein MTR67_031480 [Solanum verrucosum]
MVGNMAYELELQAKLVAVHPVFHISLLKKCMGDPASIIPLESVVVKDSLTYEEVQVEILDRQIRNMFGHRNKETTERCAEKGIYGGDLQNVGPLTLCRW